MKPYRRPKLKVRPRGWTEREVLLALGSLVFAAIGGIATAVAAYLAYQQVAAINRERMTPYRAILYSEKLKSYQQVIHVSHDAQDPLMEFYVDMQNGTYLNPNIVAMGQGSHFKNGMPDDVIRAASLRLRPIVVQLERTMAENSVMWPDQVRRDMDGQAGSASSIIECLDAILETKHKLPFSPERTCEEFYAVRATKQLDDGRDKLNSEMRALLISDDMQRIR